MEIKLIKDKIRVDRGGASWSVHLLASELTRRGHDVEVVTVHFTGTPNELPDNPIYTLTEKPLDNYTQVDGAARTYAVLNEFESPDLIHSFQPQLNPVLGGWKQQNQNTAAVGRLNSYENFCTNHALIDNECYKNCTLGRKWAHHPDPSVDALPKMAFDTWVQPRLLNNLDALFALSPAVADIFDGYGVDEHRLTVIPNFYEESFGEGLHYNCAAGSEYRAVYVGRLVEKKGVHLLAEAVQRMDTNIKVDIVGEGPQREKLEKLSPQNIVFHGHVDHQEVARHFARADVFVHPGVWPEPFGRTVLEAMQCGCVPVVSDVGGPPWIVGDAGKTFNRGDVDSLATTLEGLTSERTRRDYGERLSERLSRFSPQVIVDEIEQTYLEIQT